MVRDLVIGLCFFFLAASAAAEEIVLSSGMTLSGQIIERSEDKIKVHASGMVVTYYKDEVRSIDGKPFESSVPSAVKDIDPPETEEPALIQKYFEIPKQARSVDAQDHSLSMGHDIQTVETRSSVVSTQTNGSTLTAQGSSTKSVRTKKLTPAQLVTVAMVTLAVVGLIFVLACYPVYLIAKKTNAPYPYYAFIPILNYYLLCKIAGRPVWWMVLYFVPFLGMVIDVIVWMDIAKVRNKPNWMGLLVLVPLANLGMMWYLALSDQ